jgi:hypothetical protein
MDRIPGTSNRGDFPIRNYPLIALTAILLGGIIYILFRPVSPLFVYGPHISLFQAILETARQDCLSLASYLPRWIIYSLPQGLWAFAYALIIAGIWKNQHTWVSYLWLWTIPLMVFGFEVLQHAGVVRGTFCLQDLLCGMGGIVLGVMIVYGRQWHPIRGKILRNI